MISQTQILDEFLKVADAGVCKNSPLKVAMNMGISLDELNLNGFHSTLDLIDLYFKNVLKSLGEITPLDDGISANITHFTHELFMILSDNNEANVNITKYLKFHPCFGQKSLFRQADLIWSKCCENDTNFNYYSKRILLSKIIAKNVLKCTFKKNFNVDKSVIKSDIAKTVSVAKWVKSKFFFSI